MSSSVLIFPESCSLPPPYTRASRAAKGEIFILTDCIRCVVSECGRAAAPSRLWRTSLTLPLPRVFPATWMQQSLNEAINRPDSLVSARNTAVEWGCRPSAQAAHFLQLITAHGTRHVRCDSPPLHTPHSHPASRSMDLNRRVPYSLGDTRSNC